VRLYDRGVSLIDALAMLRGWLTDAGHAVPDAPVRMFEVPRAAPIANGRSVINRDRLVAVEAYAQRFRELQDDAATSVDQRVGVRTRGRHPRRCHRIARAER